MGRAVGWGTYSVDFPAPLDPTIAIRDSRPTSILMRFKMIFEVSYPNVTSESWSKGGDIFSVSGNLDGNKYEGFECIHDNRFTHRNFSVSSATGGVSS